MKQLAFAVLLLIATSSYAAVVQPVGAAPQLLIPGAGSTEGTNGTFFKSDITLVNLTTHDQNVLLEWLPAPGLTRPAPVAILIHAQSGIRSSDFVGEVLHQSGVGAIVVTGVASDVTTPDPTARLFVSARIWTPQPQTGGTTSQSFYVLPTATLNTPSAAIFGMGGGESPSTFRVNVGIVNASRTQAQTFVIQYSTTAAAPPSVVTVTLPPLTMQQVAIGIPFGGSAILVNNVTADATRSNLWTAYGSTIDNVTGDAWSEIAVAGTAP